MQTPTQTTRSASGISSLKTRVLHIATQSLVAVSRFQLFSRWSRVVAGILFANKQLYMRHHRNYPSIHPFQKLHPYTAPRLFVVRTAQLLHVAVSYLGIYLSFPWFFFLVVGRWRPGYFR
jgi:hypothetical protein